MRSSPKRFVPICALVVALIGGRATPATANIWRFASEWLDFSWNVSLMETYDDNISSSVDNRESDFITSFGFNTKFVIRHPLGQFNLYYRFDQSLYLSHDELNDVGSFAGLGQNQNVSFGDSVSLTRRDLVTYYVGVTRSPESLHLNGRDRRSNLQNVDLEGIVVGQNPVTRGNAHLNYGHQFAAPVNFGLDGGYAITEYDDPVRLDSRTMSGGASLSWRISPLRSVGVRYSISVNEFDSLPRARSDIYSVIYQDAFAPTWSLSAEVGASINDTTDNSVNHVTPDADVRLHKDFKRGSGMLGYSRSVGTSEGLGGTSENQAVTAAGTYQHSEIWSSSVSATWSERVSKASSNRAFNGTSRRFIVRCQTTYPLTRVIRLRGGYLFSRESVPGRTGSGDVTNNQVFVGLTYGTHLL